MDLDSHQVKILIKVSKNLQRVADKVVFLNVPESPFFLSSRGAVANARIEFLKRALQRSGALVWDMGQDVSLSEDDYTDLIHFSPSGSEKFNSWLASRVIEDRQ